MPSEYSANQCINEMLTGDFGKVDKLSISDPWNFGVHHCRLLICNRLHDPVHPSDSHKTMDKHDLMILDIVQQHKREQQEHIRLAALERNFWKRIEGDVTLSVGQARIGERITRLYLDGLIQNKSGYMLTKKGREALTAEHASLAQVA